MYCNISLYDHRKLFGTLFPVQQTTSWISHRVKVAFFRVGSQYAECEKQQFKQYHLLQYEHFSSAPIARQMTYYVCRCYVLLLVTRKPGTQPNLLNIHPVREKKWLFRTSSVLVANPKKYFIRWQAPPVTCYQGKYNKKRKSGSAPRPPHAARTEGGKTHIIYVKRDFLQETVNGELAELVRALVVPMEDAWASFQILCLSAASLLSHLLRTVSPSITCQAAADYDVLVEWALAPITAGDGAAAAGLPTPEEVAHDPNVCQKRTYLGHQPLRQVHLPIQEGDLGLTSSSSIKGAAYIGCHALVLGIVVAASARGNLPPLLKQLPERPMAQALLDELKTVVTVAKRQKSNIGCR